MKQTYPTSIYIAKENETIESIASANGIKHIDIITLNSRYKNIKIQPGCPVHMPMKQKQEEIRVQKEDTSKKDLLKRKVNQLNYDIKELLLSRTFISENYETVLTGIKDDLRDIETLLIDKKLPSKKITEVIELLAEFVTILESNDSKKIAMSQKRLDRVTDELITILTDNKDNSTRLDNNVKIHDIKKKWQLYILKIASLKFNEAKRIFDDIIEKVDNLIDATFSA